MNFERRFSNRKSVHCAFFRREVHGTKKLTEKCNHIKRHNLHGNIKYKIWYIELRVEDLVMQYMIPWTSSRQVKSSPWFCYHVVVRPKLSGFIGQFI